MNNLHKHPLADELRAKLKESNANGNDTRKRNLAVDLAVGPVVFDKPGEQTERFCRWILDMVEMGYHGWTKP